MDNEALVLEFLAWLADRPRPHAEVMSAWGTSCPRLTVREDALDAGLVRVESDGPRTMVHLTERGRSLLRQRPDEPPS